MLKTIKKEPLFAFHIACAKLTGMNCKYANCFTPGN